MPSTPGFELKPWQRFHVRVTLLTGVIVFMVLAIMGLVFYDLAYSTEFEALQARIRSTVGILGRRIDPKNLDKIDRQKGMADTIYRDLYEDLSAICREDPDIYTVYVLKRTEVERELSFIVDVSDDPVDSAKPGDRYVIQDHLKVMLRGLDEVTVEDSLTADKWGLSLGGYAPLRYVDGRSYGLVGVDVDASHIDEMRHRLLITTLLIFGAAAFALFVMAILMGRRMRGSHHQKIVVVDDALAFLGGIDLTARRIAGGDFDHELRLERRDEFGLMGHHFNTIAKSLKERDFLRDTFGRYVSPDIAKKVLQDRSAAALGGEEREVTVVFSDIEGYSTMTELIPPQQVLGMLNTYLGAMNEIIDQHSGCIIEFLGDAILAVFNAPNDVGGHADTGVRCALAMRERLDALNREWESQPIAEIWRKAGKEKLKARVGIHTGRVVAGNLGSRTRMKYGLIGDVVNVAARIEALNKKLVTTLLISDDTWHALSDDLKARATDRGEHDVKGRSHTVRVWEL
ncbi:MAG TPA: adenylate/guanylate cyclase domain-containing protein [Myxococcota bacterium]|nr:adenylate/guanylate cyclase domain-containing protein [Myxococcota bacterium]